MYERRNKYLERRNEERERNRGSMRDRYDDMRDRRYEEDRRRMSRDRRYDDREDYRYDRPRRDMEYDRMYDYSRDYARDYAYESEEYDKDLHEWANDLKAYDRFKVPKDQVIIQAKNMGVEFKDFDEEEFYVTYLMLLSDYKSIANDYNIYVKMANDFLTDKDAALKGSDKLCAYMYEIVMDK